MNNNIQKTRIYRFLIFLTFSGLGAVLAWLIFDFKPPGGVIIMMGSVVGYLVSFAAFPRTQELEMPSVFDFRGEGQWPIIRKLSSVFFFIFFCLAGIFSSPKIMENNDLRRGLFLLFSGLSLLGGTPIMFALKSNLKLLGFCSLFMSLMLIVTGLMGALQVEIRPLIKMFVLFLGMVVPLMIILVFLNRNRR